MELHEVSVTGGARHDMPWQEILIYPVSDVQLGAAGCDADRFRKYIKEGIDRGAWFIGAGDYIDFMSPSNRSRSRNAELYDDTQKTIENAAEALRLKFMRLVRGTEGRWLGLVEGHHFYEYSDGSTTDTRIAKDLGCSFLGTCGMVRLRFNRGASLGVKDNRKFSTTIWIHHGVGGGSGLVAPINKLMKMPARFPQPQIFLIGHFHRAQPLKFPQLLMTERPPFKLKERSVVLACTGGYLRGYLVGSGSGSRPRGTYVEQGMLDPTSLGGIVIKLRPTIHEVEIGVEM